MSSEINRVVVAQRSSAALICVALPAGCWHQPDLREPIATRVVEELSPIRDCLERNAGTLRYLQPAYVLHITKNQTDENLWNIEVLEDQDTHACSVESLVVDCRDCRVWRQTTDAQGELRYVPVTEGK